MNMAMQKLFTGAMIAIALVAILLTHTAAGLLSTTQIIPSNGTITARVLSLTLGSSTNPTKTARPILIFGQIPTEYSNLPIDIQYSQDQSTWYNISTVTANSNGTFETTFAFPLSGIYLVRATCSNQMNSYSQIVADRFVNLNGSEDSVDIQTAIDSLPSTGGVVYIRSGLYDLQGKSIVSRSNLTLIGDGIDRTIIRLYPTMHDESMAINDAIVSYVPIENLLIENFTLIQNVIPVNHHGGIVFRGDKNDDVTIRNVKVTDVSGPGIGISFYNNLLIENCIIERAWTGITFAAGENALVRENTILDMTGDGIFPIFYSNNIVIENNYLKNIGDTAVDIVGDASYGPLCATHLTVRGNTIMNGPIRVSNALDVQIVGNSIYYGAIDVDSGQGTPVNVNIIGNLIVSAGRTAIQFCGAANSSAENNIIRMETPSSSVAQSGIIAAIWGTSRIINNTILNSANYGIDFGGWALGSGNSITIRSNTIQDFGNFGIYDDNRHTETVYVEYNTFIYNAIATAIFVEDPANHWIIDGNIFIIH
jgi:hypothetical protein